MTPDGFKMRLHSSSIFRPSSKETCSIMCSEYMKSNDSDGISKLLVASSLMQSSSGRRVQVGGQPSGPAIPSGPNFQTVRTRLGEVVDQSRIELVWVLQLYVQDSTLIWAKGVSFRRRRCASSTI